MQPARRLTDVDYQRVTEFLQTTGDSLTTHSARFYTLMATKTCFYGRIISFYDIFMYFAKLELICQFFYILYNICIYYLYFKISFIIPWVCFISLVFNPEFPWNAVPEILSFRYIIPCNSNRLNPFCPWTIF